MVSKLKLLQAIFPDDIARFKHAYSVNTSGTYDEEEKEALTILIAKSRLSIVGLSHLSRYMELSDWPDATKLASKYLTELKQRGLKWTRPRSRWQRRSRAEGMYMCLLSTKMVVL
ncbi:unnamed protein product [Linum tenue]|uniref:Uncharacterized protein n=1 Tax=Linum tenue TaxID=586396 RepID=A0AAV0NI02_9ROSI|nr:unnamed protein product [Linum tenue]